MGIDVKQIWIRNSPQSILRGLVNCVGFGSPCLWPTRLADKFLDPLHQMMNLFLLYLAVCTMALALGRWRDPLHQAIG